MKMKTNRPIILFLDQDWSHIATHLVLLVVGATSSKKA